MAQASCVNTSLSRGKYSLKEAVSDAKPLYILPKDPVVTEVLIPALQTTERLDVMMGYFASKSFGEIAPGLASFLRSSQAPMRLIVSPFLTAPDFEILTKDASQLAEIARNLLIGDIPDKELLTLHTLECIAWLISQERLILRVAVMRNALFHPKVWLFDDGASRAALHGSTNLTQSGLSRNLEQLSLSRDWKSDEALFHVERFRQEFDDLWSGGDEECCVITLPDAVANEIIKLYKTKEMPEESTFEREWQKANGIKNPHPEPMKPIISALKIPEHLEYESGPFAHQGQAVKAWEQSGRRGILEMATGAGKTITSMICATRLQNELASLMVIVSAPYKPLIAQWCDEIQEFELQPINLSASSCPAARSREIKQAGRRLRMGSSRAEVLVVSNDILCTEKFIETIEQINVPKLFIADECHNLGAKSFTKKPPENFDFRLGLSATPIRQYDVEGTEALFNFFGNICFSFTLEEAIGKCLTSYDYHVHFAELDYDEMTEWDELTSKIKSQSWKANMGEKDPYFENLLRQRRLILESASSKINILSDIIDSTDPRALRYTLIYATDKNPRQLEQVNEILDNRGILFHQLTQEETQNRDRTKSILRTFQDGITQVLTAKRVLDEGVNIPQIMSAYILASTTVKRQWVQRRGRLLRKCKEIGKTHAIIHDFVVLPPGMTSSAELLDADARRLIRSELERVWEFARLSRNGPNKGGPYEAVEHLQNLANERIIN